jgi:hypothetical protein
MHIWLPSAKAERKSRYGCRIGFFDNGRATQQGHLLSLGVTFVEFVPQATRRKVLNRCPFPPLLPSTLVVVATEVFPVVKAFEFGVVWL